VRLINTSGGVSWSQRLVGVNALRSTQELAVGLGPSMGLGEAAATIRRRGDAGINTVQIASAEELPDHWWGYDGVDMLALATSDPQFIQALTSDQRQAIVDWVQLGGRLLLSAGARGAEVADPKNGLSALVPGELAEVTPLRE